MHVRLEGGLMLSEIILFCSENALSDRSDDGLDGVKKNPYRFNVRRKLLRSNEDPPEDIPGGGKKSELYQMLRGEVLSDV
jgi:hypothetical protein